MEIWMVKVAYIVGYVFIGMVVGRVRYLNCTKGSAYFELRDSAIPAGIFWPVVVVFWSLSFILYILRWIAFGFGNVLFSIINRAPKVPD